MRTSSKITGAAILILLLVAGVVWAAALREDRRGLFTVSFLNAGKSEVIFIDAPSGRKVLIDGGSNASILRELSKVMPWYDRSLDVVVATHPDAAHASGLIDVLQRYSVSHVFQSSAPGSGPVMQTFQQSLSETQKKGTKVSVARRGEIIDVGKGAYIEVLFPDRSLSGVPASSACIEMQLVYGATSFMLSCGNAAIEDYLVRLDGSELRSDILYAGGATSSPLFAGFVGAQFIAQSGMTFVSDGKTVHLK